MKKAVIVLVVAVVSQVSVFAQEVGSRTNETSKNIIIKGTLSEIVNNEKVALPFANVFIEGTTYVTTTDFEGNFTLETEAGSYNLKCTFMGYDSYVKSITEENRGTIELDILMKPESTTMLDVDIATKN
ncbi:MAG: carboxypeptidase-like regulatory domain-containing protein [Salinivirgaceae bacterium]|jgi:hypothetical protein